MATHACIVEVDLETGLVSFPRYLVVEDCGPVINPAIVDGQVRGGVAQGIGAVLYEKAAYDDDANMQAATYMDYLLPTAMEIPDIEVHHLETISPGGENDFRGVGEGGMIGAPAAITNAIEDALSTFGARVDTQYNPPSRILELAGIIPAPETAANQPKNGADVALSATSAPFFGVCHRSASSPRSASRGLVGALL